MGSNRASLSESEHNGPARFVVGIDLGTTNSAVCYVDTQAMSNDGAAAKDNEFVVQVLSIPQLVSAGQVEARETLPSFHYHPSDGEFANGALNLPWQHQNYDHCVGVLARDHGIHVPGRMIASAKSWLCHPGVDRTAPILPWQ